MVRGVLSVLVGVVFWAVGFFVLALLLAQLWPDYAIHGRQWTRENVFTFTSLMACCNLIFWLLAETGAGWAAGKIAKRREAVWVLAGLLGIYLVSCISCFSGPASRGGTTLGWSFQLFPLCYSAASWQTLYTLLAAKRALRFKFFRLPSRYGRDSSRPAQGPGSRLL